MALFTDGNIAELNDLRAYESGILDLAANEGIDLGAKLSLAHREIGLEILSFLVTQGYGVAKQRGLENVIVTEPILHSEVMWTLSLIYRDAFNSQLNDRYGAKWNQYTDLARRGLRQYFEIGIGLTASPIGKPEPPTVSVIPGPSRAASTYSVQVAACGLNGFTGALSDSLTVHCRDNASIMVQLGGVLPERSSGWILYVGEGDSDPKRQNVTPLEENAVWTCPDSGTVQDLPSIQVQRPEFWAVQQRRLLRG